MTELKDEQKDGKHRKKYLWFGFGNYGGQPFEQIGGGYTRDPGFLGKVFKRRRNGLAGFILYVAVGILLLTLLALAAAWAFSIFTG